MFGFLDMLTGPSYEHRKVGRWDNEAGDQMVSTAAVTDGREPYETAFMHPDYNDGKMVIVECYSTREAAEEGHARWVKTMTHGPLPNRLIDCANAEVAQFLNALGGRMIFPRKGAYAPFGYGIGLDG